MEPILHENYPLSKRRISQLQCKAQLTPPSQGFSSLPRVSEAFTPNTTFNPQPQSKKTKSNANRFNILTHIHKHLQHAPYTNTLILQETLLQFPSSTFMKWKKTWHEALTSFQSMVMKMVIMNFFFLDFQASSKTLSISTIREWVNNH